MPLFGHEHKSQLSFSHSKSLSRLIKQACGQCNGSCIRTSSSLSSKADYLHENDLDEKQLTDHYTIVMEIRSRALKAKYSKNKELVIRGRLVWANSPTTGRILITEEKEKVQVAGKQESACVTNGYCVDDENDQGYIIHDDDESEDFYSVKSYFSCCPSDDGATTEMESQRRSILMGDQFKDCEGWPFGLYRRSVMLPPLPSSPSDSWMWHKRNIVSKA